ncbi:MAG: PKD-like domain-containing protein, partial [Saprospiraceae bacterium]
GMAYAWTRNNLNNVTGMPASGSDAPITGTPVNVTNQNRTTTLSIIPTGGNGCVGDPFTVSITVRPEPVALATPIAQTVCSGAPITPITIGYVNSVASSTFSWTRSNTGNVTGLPNAGTTTPISGNPVSVSGLPDTTVFTVTPVSGAGCVGRPVTATVRIKNSPVGGHDQSTACNGQAVNYDLQQNVNTLGNGVNADFSWVAVSNNPNVTGESLTPAVGDLITDVLTLTGLGPETVTYAVTPDGGNCPGATFFITIVLTLNDVVAPTITCPADLSLEGCSPTDLSGPGYSPDLALISVGDFTALNGQVEDNCGLQTGMNYRDAAAGQCPIAVSRTFVASDLAGNTASCVQRIFIQDKTQPALLEPADITVSCETDLADLTLVGAALATDNCGAVTVQYADDRSGLTGCSGTGTITRTWSASDACQNTTSAVQLITLTDLTPPVFNPTCQFQPLNILTSAGYDCPADAAISLKAGDLLSVSSTWTVGGYSVPALTGCIQDNCSAQQAIVIEVLAVEVEDALPCRRTIRVRFEIRDACGNAQPQPFDCIYNILDDEAPLFAPPADLTLNCAQDPNNLQLTGNVAQAFDDCSGTTSIQFADDRTDLNGCNGTGLLRRTWRVADACNNLASAVQVITIQDKKAPVFSNVPANITVECGAIPPAGMPSATDNCDLQPIVTYNGESRANGNCADQYVLTRSWTAGDVCGNTETVSQTIVVRDTQAPIFGNMPPNLTVECDEIPPVGMPIALDQCDLQPEVFYVGETRFNGQCDNEFILRRTWTAFDNCGNAATSTQTLVVRDTRPPVFTSVPADQTVSCDAVPTPGAPVAADLCDQQVAIDYLGQSRTDGQCPDSYTLTRRWIAVDNCGNTATAVQVIAVRDQQPPSFTFVPVNTTAECNAIPAPGTPAATDNCDQQVAVSYLGQTRTDGACADQYTITRSWVAEDNCGNTAVATQQIVVSDTQAPVFISSPVNITVECDAIPDPETPTATDNCDQQVAIAYTGQTRIDGPCPDSYGLHRSWTATDNCGNTASTSQLVTVRDTKPPVFTSVPPAVTVACDSVSAPGTPTATDNCDQQVHIDYVGQTRQDGNCPGWYTLTRSWVAVDNCGNTATATQVIQVRDIQSPVFTFVPAAVTVNCDAIPTPGAPVAVDNCDQQPVISFNGETRTDGQCPNAYTLLRSWIAADHCGNSTIATQLIAVQDTTPPTFTAPADVTVYVRANCGYDANLQVTGDVTNESDNCSGDLQAVFTADTLPVNSGKAKWVVRRHWKLTDACGNMSAVQVQRIFVHDTIPPAIVCPQNITLQANQTCTAVLNTFPYSATDNCPEIMTSYLRSGATTGNGVGVPVGLSFNAGLTTVTLVATDGVGNTAACSFTVKVVNCAITLGGQITFEHNNAPVPNATVN